MIDETELEKLKDIPVPWEAKGFPDAKEYVLDLTSRWEKINTLVKSGEGDTSIVKSTLFDTIEFIAWAHTKRELNATVAMVKAHLTKYRMKTHGIKHKSDSKRVDEGT